MFLPACKATFYKECCLLKNRLKSYCISVFLGYLIVLFVILFLKSKESSSFMILYSTMYMGFISYVYLMRFWEEKVTGTMEYTLTLDRSIKRIIIFKVLSYSLLGLIFMLFFFALSSALLLSFHFLNLILCIGVYFFLVIPYGLINGCGMWCLNSGVAKLIQYISIGLIIAFIGGVILPITDTNMTSFYFPAVLLIGAIFWLFGLVLLAKAKKEKAILSAIE